MECPNCGRTMIDESYWYRGFHTGVEPDYDYLDCHTNKFVCKFCNIKFEADDEELNYSKSDDPEKFWDIPDRSPRATKKQVKAVQAINYYLHTGFVPILKNSTSKFIRDHQVKSYLERDRRKSLLGDDENYDSYDYDYYDALFGDVF